jgi:micrococcal nuclease
LLAISVPPSHSTQSAEYLRARLRRGQVMLALDKRRIDSQGRILAYVYVDGELLNAELVQQGLAQVAPYPGDSASIGRELYRAQDLAHSQRAGIWAEGAKPLRGRAALEAAPED